MRRYIHLCLVLIPGFTFAQLTETFDDNSRGWYLVGDDDCTREIVGGKYVLKTLKEGSGEFTSIPAFFDINKDFSLEAVFVQRDGSINNGIGLYWGFADSKTYNEFVFTTNGYYKIGEGGTGKWIDSKLIKPLNNENTLRMEKRGDSTYHYLNGILLTRSKLVSYGFKAGFINYTNMTLEVDDVHFIQDNKINLAPDAAPGLTKENLGAGVNSVAYDLLPNISADGLTLYFVRKYHEQNMGGKEDASDIWVSTWENGRWTAARNLNAPINSTSVDNLTAVSADNNSVFLIRGSKFVSSKRSADGWLPLADIGLSYATTAEYMESALSADGKVLLVTLKTPDNLYYQEKVDEKDIYVSLQNKDGTWRNFVNLGPNVNSGGDETSPFLSPDGRTLYFSTTGRPGYGGSDIFISKRIGDGWANWSEPMNLGPSVNTAEFDAYYTVPASGDYAYMVSRKNAIGETDIVRIKLPKAIKPDPVILIFGKTINAHTKEPLTAEILLDDLGSGKEVAEAFSNPRTGAFKIVLPPGANYGLHAAAKGFLSVNENLTLISIQEYAEMEKDLLLIPIEVGVSLQLNNIFFEQGKPALRPESFPELNRLVQILKDNEGLHIELNGYTDNVGSSAALLKLSEDRVTVVIDYMVSNGVSKHRLVGKGYGSANPIVLNDTEEHRKMNRRVEFKVTKK